MTGSARPGAGQLRVRTLQGSARTEVFEMRKIAKALLVTLGVVVVIEAVDAALTVWAWRSRSPRVLGFAKRSKKYVTNPVMLRFSGHSGLSAIVRHVGRRSGTPYSTPVVACQVGEDVVIPLPYGTDVDWLRNWRAAGRAIVDLEGHSFIVTEPAVLDLDAVVDGLPSSMVRIVRFNGARHAVRTRVSGVADPAAA